MIDTIIEDKEIYFYTDGRACRAVITVEYYVYTINNITSYKIIGWYYDINNKYEMTPTLYNLIEHNINEEVIGIART